MKIYNYDALTGEFLNEEEANLDPLENNKFLLPAFATFTPVVLEKSGFARCFIKGVWEYVKNLRGLKQINIADFEVSEIKEIGELKEGFYLISEEEISALRQGKIAAIEGGVLTLKDRPLTELKEIKKAEINAIYEQKASLVKIDTPESEISTWYIQESEALEWDKDNTKLTPFIDGLASARQMNRLELLGKVLNKVKTFKSYMSELTGKRQYLEDLIKVATTKEELDNIKW